MATENGRACALLGRLQDHHPASARHARRVAALAAALGSDLRLRATEVELLRLGGLLHDLGKLQVPATVLDGVGPLDREGREAIRRHPVAGLDRLSGCGPWPATVVDVVVPQGFEAGAEGRRALEKLLPHTDYFLPNDDEAQQLTGHTDSVGQLLAFRKMGANTVILTRGTAGAVAAKGDDYWQAAAYEMDVIDPSGSGDAFASGVIYSVLRGWDLQQTLRYAAAVGGSSTLAVGTTSSVWSAPQALQFIETNPLAITSGRLTG